jgi:low affinity Fe/Cu permease
MAKSRYVTFLQKCLAEGIQNHIDSKNLSKSLEVEEEYSLTLSDGRVTILDIAIINSRDHGIVRDGAGPNKVVGIEIEYKNSPNQIIDNYDKFKFYIDNKYTRRGALIHLFSNLANFSEEQYKDLEEKIESDNDNIVGFLCKIATFDVTDERAFRQKADEILANLSFKRKLNSFIREIFDVEFK